MEVQPELDTVTKYEEDRTADSEGTEQLRRFASRVDEDGTLPT